MKGLDESEEKTEMTVAQRARAERQRLRARELRAGRVQNAAIAVSSKAPTDTGGGFMPEEPLPPKPVTLPPAPLPTAEAPPCLQCSERVHTSLLLDSFGRAVCDNCRDTDPRWDLVARTEARKEYLLQECDLDKRPPPLKCVKRPNPHRTGGEMRLYLRADLEERAEMVWGEAGGVEAEKARREATRAARGAVKLRKGVLALRPIKDRRTTAQHTHEWGPGDPHPDLPDTFIHTCTICQITTTIETM